MQLYSKAIHDEAFSECSVSLLLVVDVNGVLLEAAAPLKAFLVYVVPPHLTLIHFPGVTLAILQLKTRGNPSAMKMNTRLPLMLLTPSRGCSSQSAAA